MFKKLQRSIATLVHDNGHHTVDIEFDAAKQNWLRLTAVLQEVRKQILEQQDAMRSMVQSSYGAVEALATLFPQATVSLQSAAGRAEGVPTSPPVTTAVHPYCALAHASKHTLFQLQHDRLDSCTRRLGATCLANTNELLDKFASLRARVIERDESLKELDYYANKTMDLRKELSKCTAAGRKEQPKDEERRLRNEETLARMQLSFDATNRQLTAELQSYWDRRLDLLSPILRDFFAGSYNFVAEVNEAHSDIKMAQRGLPPIEFATVLFEVVCPQVAAQTSTAGAAAATAGIATATSTAATSTPPSSALKSPDLSAAAGLPPSTLPAVGGVNANGTRALRVQSAGANAGSPPPPPPSIVAAAAAFAAASSPSASASASPPLPKPRSHGLGGGINATSPPSYSSPSAAAAAAAAAASASPSASASPQPPLPPLSASGSPSSAAGGGSSAGSGGSASAPPPKLPPRKMERPLPPPPQTALTKPVVPGSSGGGAGNASSSPASNGAPPPLPPPIPSAAALAAASASASYSNGTIPVSLYPQQQGPQPPQPPPPPPSLRTSSGSSSGSPTPLSSPHSSVAALSAAGAAATVPASAALHSLAPLLSPEQAEELDDRYAQAAEGADQPSFVAQARAAGPPPLPPTNQDPEQPSFPPFVVLHAAFTPPASRLVGIETNPGPARACTSCYTHYDPKDVRVAGAAGASAVFDEAQFCCRHCQDTGPLPPPPGYRVARDDEEDEDDDDRRVRQKVGAGGPSFAPASRSSRGSLLAPAAAASARVVCSWHSCVSMATRGDRCAAHTPPALPAAPPAARAPVARAAGPAPVARAAGPVPIPRPAGPAAGPLPVHAGRRVAVAHRAGRHRFFDVIMLVARVSPIHLKRLLSWAKAHAPAIAAAAVAALAARGVMVPAGGAGGAADPEVERAQAELKAAHERIYELEQRLKDVETDHRIALSNLQEEVDEHAATALLLGERTSQLSDTAASLERLEDLMAPLDLLLEAVEIAELQYALRKQTGLHDVETELHRIDRQLRSLVDGAAPFVHPPGSGRSSIVEQYADVGKVAASGISSMHVSSSQRTQAVTRAIQLRKEGQSVLLIFERADRIDKREEVCAELLATCATHGIILATLVSDGKANDEGCSTETTEGAERLKSLMGVATTLSRQLGAMLTRRAGLDDQPKFTAEERSARHVGEVQNASAARVETARENQVKASVAAAIARTGVKQTPERKDKQRDSRKRNRIAKLGPIAAQSREELQEKLQGMGLPGRRKINGKGESKDEILKRYVDALEKDGKKQ